jgi:hypothetical protein
LKKTYLFSVSNNLFTYGHELFQKGRAPFFGVPDHDDRCFLVRVVPFEFYQITCGQFIVDGDFGAYRDSDAPLEALAQAVDAGKFKDFCGDLLLLERPLERLAVTSVGFG